MGVEGRQFLEMMVAKGRSSLFLLKCLQHVLQGLFPPHQLPALPLQTRSQGAPPSVGGEHLHSSLASSHHVDLGRGMLFLSCFHLKKWRQVLCSSSGYGGCTNDTMCSELLRTRVVGVGWDKSISIMSGEKKEVKKLKGKNQK